MTPTQIVSQMQTMSKFQPKVEVEEKDELIKLKE
jgi:hypothetical protein